MNKYISILLAFLFSSYYSQVKADDASAVAYEHWSYGHIKADTPNKQIALDKELMIVTENSIEAIFIFRNTTDEYVETPCVFPISASLNIPQSEEEGDSTFAFAMQGSPDPYAWSIYLDKRVSSSSRENCVFSFSKSDMKAADKKLRKYTYEEYLKRVRELTDSTYSVDCDITQNGQKVEIKNVGIETGKCMDIYFYHFLKFKPYEVSKVVVSYPIESFEYTYDCEIHSFVYDISSGGTWKDNIKSFMVYSTMNMESHSDDITNQKFECCEFSSWKVYYKKDYKPIKGDIFDFKKECGTYLGNVTKEWQKDRIDYYLKKDSIIKITEGRDELNPLARYPQRAKASPFIADIKSSDNQDASPLFDGNLYTSYVTSPHSYIEFTLNSVVVGPFVSNGFVSNSFNERVFYAKQEERKREDFELDSDAKQSWDDDYNFPVFQDTTWDNTSRLKSMTLTKNIKDAQPEIFALADKYGVLPQDCAEQASKVVDRVRDNWKDANSVHHPKVLMPGRYRLTFDSIYKGDKTNSLGLSEIWFYEYPIDLVNIVEEDQKDSLPIFQDCFNQIEREWVTNYDYIPYKLLRSQRSPFYKECLRKYGSDSLNLELDSLGNYRLDMDNEATVISINDGEPSPSRQNDNKADVAADSSDKESDSKLYIIIGAALLLIAAGAGVFFLRKKK